MGFKDAWIQGYRIRRCLLVPTESSFVADADFSVQAAQGLGDGVDALLSLHLAIEFCAAEVSKALSEGAR